MPDTLTKLLRSHGQSSTSCRQQVFTALKGQEPMTMAELVSRCPSINRASIYRTVALFEELGVIIRLQTGWKYKLELSDTFHDHHHHATCLACGTSLVLEDSPALERQVAALAAQSSFQVQRHQLELQGYCSTCQTSAT